MFSSKQEMLKDLVDFIKNCPESSNYIIDPGIGFGKRFHHSLTILQNIEELLFQKNLRIMIGHSRKGFLGKFYNIEDARQRDAETIGMSIGILNKCEFLRVHEPILHSRAILSYLHTKKQLI